MSVALFLGLLAAVVVERLLELRLSKRNARLAFEAGAVEVGQRHYRVMVVVHSAFLLCSALEVVLLRRPFPGLVGLVALAAVAAAQALRYWAVATLGTRWNVRVIALPNAPPVTGGPYRFVRHPNYVAVALEILALPLVHGAWLTAIAFSAANALLLWVRIRAEEEALGALYREAFAGRPRFVPRAMR